MKRCLYLLLTIAVLTSCEQEIPYNGEYQDPKLVLQLREELQEGQYYVGCLISRSAFFLDKLSSPAELRINDASVTMQCNEDEPIALPREGNGAYGEWGVWVYKWATVFSGRRCYPFSCFVFRLSGYRGLRYDCAATGSGPCRIHV